MRGCRSCGGVHQAWEVLAQKEMLSYLGVSTHQRFFDLAATCIPFGWNEARRVEFHGDQTGETP